MLVSGLIQLEKVLQAKALAAEYGIAEAGLLFPEIEEGLYIALHGVARAAAQIAAVKRGPEGGEGLGGPARTALVPQLVEERGKLLLPRRQVGLHHQGHAQHIFGGGQTGGMRPAEALCVRAVADLVFHVGGAQDKADAFLIDGAPHRAESALTVFGEAVHYGDRVQFLFHFVLP